jgi:hypothetical protein
MGRQASAALANASFLAAANKGKAPAQPALILSLLTVICGVNNPALFATFAGYSNGNL